MTQSGNYVVHVSAYSAAVFADHGAPRKRKPSPLPIHVSRAAISSPVVDRGQFSETMNVRDDSIFISFAEVPLGPNGFSSGVREMYA